MLLLDICDLFLKSYLKSIGEKLPEDKITKTIIQMQQLNHINTLTDIFSKKSYFYLFFKCFINIFT